MHFIQVFSFDGVILTAFVLFDDLILTGSLTGADDGIWFANIDRRAETFEFWSDLMPNRVQLFTQCTPGGVKLKTQHGVTSSTCSHNKQGAHASFRQTDRLFRLIRNHEVSWWTYFDEPDVIDSSRLHEAVQHNQINYWFNENVTWPDSFLFNYCFFMFLFVKPFGAIQSII